MARSEAIEARLKRWGEWRKCGDASGYPSVSILHPNWSPPTPGMRPAPVQSRWSDARQTDKMVRMLSQRLQDTLVLAYCTNVSRREAAERLACAESTVTLRVEQAHRMLLMFETASRYPIDVT